MKLIDENYNSSISSKKIMVAAIIGILLVTLIIVGLLVFVISINGNKAGLTVNNKKATQYLYEKDSIKYIGIEDLTKLLGDGYTFKNGTKLGEDDSRCYVTNSNIYESVFFEVNSKEIYKVMEDTNEVEYYTIDNPIIKENGKIYMPINSINLCLNAIVTNNKNKYAITSIEAFEGKFNKSKSKNFNPDDSIVWNTTPSNKKMLKKQLVVIKDSRGQLGIAKVNSSYDKKSKTTTVTTTPVIDPKYDYIKYVEKYNELIVEAQEKRGIIKLAENNGDYTKTTIVSLQYDDIKPISDELFLVTQDALEKNLKYGIVSIANNSEDLILSTEYDQIGIDDSQFTDNALTSRYIFYNNLIPVKKDGLWGFVNLNGSTIIKIEYSNVGCIGANTNNNVLLVPDVEGIVVAKEGKYGVLGKTGRTLLKVEATKIFKSTINGKKQYVVDIGGKEYNLVDYIKNPTKYQKK
ncbi:MAG: WG repeat-containing protein [Clostridia bacterium]|nr:WG repeat-containing protein [Clostridia bacterium]